jgi:hypothetical protein
MDGGALVAEGGYGCVFAPALKCAGRSTHMGSAPVGKRTFLTKVYKTKGDLGKEWEVARVIAGVDPEQRLFLYPTEHCAVRRRTVAQGSAGSDGKRCTFTSSSAQATFPAARMPSGGTAFNRWLVARRRVTLRDVVRTLLPCIDAVGQLARSGIVHQDLKANNIVVDAAGVARLIDFGLIARHATFYDAKNPFIDRRSKYWLLPPEYRLRAWMLRHPGEAVPARRMEALERDELRMRFGGEDVAQLHKLRDAFWPSAEENAKALAGAVLGLQRSGGQLQLSKIDVYSLGLVFMWATQYASEFRRADADALGAYAALVRGMTHPDPARRWTAGAARKAADAFLEG